MSLFEQLGGKAQQPQQMTMQQALQQLQANPAGVLKQGGYNVPGNLNNPQQIIQYLLQTGQMGNQRLQALQQMASRFIRR